MTSDKVKRYRALQIELIYGRTSLAAIISQADQDTLCISRRDGETLGQAMARVPDLGRCDEPRCTHVWDWGDIDAAERHYYQCHAQAPEPEEP